MSETPKVTLSDLLWNEHELVLKTGINDLREGKKGMFEKDTEVYTDKSVTEYDLPELIICYKDSTCYVVKDICIDEGVPSQDKVLIENGGDSDKGLFSLLPSDSDKNVDIEFPVSEVMKSSEGNGSDDHAEVSIGSSVLDELKSQVESGCAEDVGDQCGATDKNVDIEFPVSEVLKSSEENGFDDHGVDQCNSEDTCVDERVGIESSISDELKSRVESDCIEDASNQCGATEMVANDVSETEIDHKDDLLVCSVVEENSVSAVSSDCDNKKDKQSTQNSSLHSNSESPVPVVSVEETNNSSPTTDVAYNSKVESGSITFNFDASTEPTATRTDENIAKPKDEGVSDIHLVSSQVQHSRGGQGESSFAMGHGESSFSVAGPISGLITYSGPIAFSGSLSLRSDSSTTSTRSFAFPVLQAEWNSSPVRMAKAERRHIRKHRGWRQGLLCCRF